MSTKVFTITDTISGETVTGDSIDLEATLPTWFDADNAEVQGMVTDLIDALKAGSDLGDLAEALAISVERTA